MAANMESSTNGMYNKLCSALNLSDQSFQMVQGALPVQRLGQNLYNYFDGIPPKSVSVAYESNPLNNLSGNLANMLESTANKDAFLFQIARDNYINPSNWINGNIGTNPMYTPTFDDLMRQVLNGSSATVDFDSETASTNISNSWAQSDDSAGVGFWGTKSSSVSTSLNEKAMASKITVTIELDKYAYLPIRAGGWFFSGYFTDMYQNPDKFIGGQAEWDNLFGTSGTLQRVSNQALLVAGYTIKVKSWATYSESDFNEIKTSSETNVWPFYSSSSSSTTQSSYTFNDDKSISVTIKASPEDLQIMGMGVISTEKAVTGGSMDFDAVAPSRLI